MEEEREGMTREEVLDTGNAERRKAYSRPELWVYGGLRTIAGLRS